MSATITIRWSDTKGEATISVSEEFKQREWITRADCLKDALCDLHNLYTQTLNEKF